MKKNLSVAINGSIFVIDEDAYKALEQYLSELEKYFSNDDSVGEIIADIEARIGELLSSKIGTSNRSVSLDDINYIIDIMGRVKDIDTDIHEEYQDSDQHESSNYQSKNNYQPRKLYRDIDNNYLGGVCAGLARYFNMDVNIVRIIFVCFFFLWSASFWVYIIVWIAIPAAKTSAQRLEMDGKEPSIDNIEEQIKNKANQMKNEFVNMKNKHVVKDKLRSASDSILMVIKLILRTFAGIIGTAAGVSAIAIAVIFVLACFTIIPIPIHDLYDNNVLAMAMQSSSYLMVLCLSAGVMIALPMTFVSYILLKIAFHGNAKVGTTWYVIGVCWLAAVAIFIGLMTRV